jgi:NAD(P)-dependent dehydrogenase (short-subunit alcohol dehydrogenase family)
MSHKNKIALVAGATRGAGRGIARALGELGMRVYCTGRSSRGKPPSETANHGTGYSLAGRPETIEETAEMVTALGGEGIALQVDHTSESQVQALCERIKADEGRLDVLVNDIWGGDDLAEWGKPFWEQSLSKGFQMLQRAVNTHIITSHYAVPLMLGAESGLIIEVTDGDSHDYRGNFFYDMAKSSVIRLAYAMSEELRQYKISAISLSPGYLRSEAILNYFGVTEANWQEAEKKDRHFIASESPLYVGRAVAALATDPKVLEKSGRAFGAATLAVEYGFTDADGRQPDFGKYYSENMAGK